MVVAVEAAPRAARAASFAWYCASRASDKIRETFERPLAISLLAAAEAAQNAEHALSTGESSLAEARQLEASGRKAWKPSFFIIEEVKKLGTLAPATIEVTEERLVTPWDALWGQPANCSL